MSQLLQVADSDANLLDAFVALSFTGGDAAAITFESQGGGRNMGYIQAHDLVISRMVALSATLLDAVVVSFDTKHLDEADRRFLLPGKTYPQLLTPGMDGVSIARQLRRAAAEVGRQEGAKGPGNRAKRIEFRFSLPSLGERPPLWLHEQLIAPSGALDVGTVLSAVKSRAASTRFNYMQDAAARKAVEMRAMRVAIDELSMEWKHVVDVSARESFDLLCRSNEAELHVEVKGTTSDGGTVVLTRNEVRHAQMHHPHVALYVVSGIDLRLVEGVPVAAGGVLTRYRPWAVNDFELVPLSFQCRLIECRDDS